MRAPVRCKSRNSAPLVTASRGTMQRRILLNGCHLQQTTWETEGNIQHLSLSKNGRAARTLLAGRAMWWKSRGWERPVVSSRTQPQPWTSLCGPITTHRQPRKGAAVFRGPPLPSPSLSLSPLFVFFLVPPPLLRPLPRPPSSHGRANPVSRIPRIVYTTDGAQLARTACCQS